MTNPTRQEIIDAHNALDGLEYTAQNTAKDEAEERFIEARKALILKALPPKPQPTMAEVEWDDDEHYLAEAEHPGWGKVIMLGMTPDSKVVRTFTKKDGAFHFPSVPPKSLTPTGKRYTLTEVSND